MLKAALLVSFVFVLETAHGATQTAITVFSGRPSIKISEGGTERVAEQVTASQATNLACVVSQIGGSYYWASRNNVQLARIDGGSFVTFVALNGAGYVRFIKPDAKSAAGLMSPTEGRFDYVEHMILGLRSVTYYGRMLP